MDKETQDNKVADNKVDNKPTESVTAAPDIKEELSGLKNEVKSLKEQESLKLSALDQHIKTRQAEAVGFLKDENNKKLLLSNMSEQEAHSLLDDIEKGEVTKRELELRAKLAYQQQAGPKEAAVIAPKTQSSPYEQIATIEGLNQTRLGVIRDMRHPYNNEHHPDHLKAVQEMKELEAKRDKLMA